jgi:hypothetical protein
MADETNAAPSEATANDPSRERVTLRAFAQKAGLADWQLAQLCAVTKHGADEAIATDAILEAALFLTDMSLGG